MRLETRYENTLAELGGRLPNGQPKMRIVAPDERLAQRPHGKWKGTPKYFDPESGKQIECLMLEQWYPPEMLGSPEAWPEELMGPFPADCDKECCNNGFWGMRSPLMYADGKFLPLSDAVMESIKQKNFFDAKWSALSEIERQRQLDANLSAREQKADADAEKAADEVWSHYATRKEQEDNADNRVWSLGKYDSPHVKGNKEPIGKPKL
jgi:hypothetical protein